MATYTTYKCDKCGKEWLSTDNTEQPVSIGIVVDFGNSSGYLRSPNYSRVQGVTWCRKCVIGIGITEPSSEREKSIAPETKLSFEDKLVILLEDLGFLRGG